MASVIKKLALSVAAVVAVVGAIYVLPAAIPGSSSGTSATTTKNVALPLPAEPPTTAGFTAAVVTVPDLNRPSRQVPAAGPHQAAPTTRTDPSAATTTAMPTTTTRASIVYTTVSATPYSEARTSAGESAAAAATPSPVPTVATTAKGSATSTSLSKPTAHVNEIVVVPKSVAAAPAKPRPVVKATNAPKAIARVTTPKPRVQPKPVVKVTAKPRPVVSKPAAPKAPPAPSFGIPVTVGNATQIIAVTAPSRYSTTGTLVAWQKGSNGRWAPRFGPVTAHLGSEGVGTPSEYHSRTPDGTYGLTEAFGRDANPGTSLPYSHVTNRDWWVSDVNSSKYNTHQICAASSCPFDTGAGENLYNAGSVYDYAVVMDVNRWPVTPGAGSAFFLHVTNGDSTAGCVAINAGTLVSIMRWLQPSAHPRIAVGIG